MSEITPLVPRGRPSRATPGAAALQCQLEATTAALTEETRRRRAAQHGWAEESRRHEALQAAAEAVLDAARALLRTPAPRPVTPQTHAAATVADRLAAILDDVTTPIAPTASGADHTRAEELARRFTRVRARLTADGSTAADDPSS